MPSKPAPDRFLNFAEVAEMIGLSEEAVRNAAREASRYSKPNLINLSRRRGNDNLNGLIPKKLQQLWPFSIHG